MPMPILILSSPHPLLHPTARMPERHVDKIFFRVQTAWHGRIGRWLGGQVPSAKGLRMLLLLEIGPETRLLLASFQAKARRAGPKVAANTAIIYIRKGRLAVRRRRRPQGLNSRPFQVQVQEPPLSGDRSRFPIARVNKQTNKQTNMRTHTWDRVLVGLFVFAAYAPARSAAVPLSRPNPIPIPIPIPNPWGDAMRAASLSLPLPLHFTNPVFSSLEAGTPFNITFSGASGPTRLRLQNSRGARDDDADTIAAHITNSYLIWTPPAALPATDYTLVLEDETSGTIVRSHVFTILAEGGRKSDAISNTQTSFAILKARIPAPSHPNISPTAKILVGLGSALIVLLVIGGVLLYYRHCNRKERRDGVPVGSRATSVDYYSRQPMPYAREPMPDMVEAPSKVYVRAKDRKEEGWDGGA
ncbi:hypothetical protein LZ554_006839 [Drepanopeziza brunnea f. sp. 'monogermtubi']|nr:hypothetical protein LZ554_006839 [Drepanopeziza brunnea f. sp. 'monogermtubi']